MDSTCAQIDQEYLPLYQTIRGGTVESIHFGAVAVVDSSGNLVAHCGNPGAITFLRSSAKPLQAIALIEKGGVDRFRLEDDEIALICASHSGTDLHLKTLSKLQKKVGVTESDLLCCTHPPFSQAARAILQDQGLEPNQNHHNCSGKHTGMLALGKLLDYPMEDYTEPDHPIQMMISSLVGEICDLPENSLILARDGCSVPAFAMPLRNAALGWAQLIDPENLSPSRQSACHTITRSMVNNPFFVAGPGRFDTRLMELAAGKLVSKAGAEAFQAVGVFPGAIKPGSSALGIALKIADGDQGKRARRAVMLEVLRQLKVLSDTQLASFYDLGPTQKISSHCQIPAGEAKPCFKLQFS